MKFNLREDLQSCLPEKVKAKANKICAKYSGWFTPSEFSNMWKELLDLGIEVLVTGTPTDVYEDGTKEWDCTVKYNGDSLYDCFFVYSVKEGDKSDKNEYNCYFS